MLKQYCKCIEFQGFW